MRYRTYAALRNIWVAFLIVGVFAFPAVLLQEVTESTVTSQTTTETEARLTRLTADYRASQDALRSAEASAACLKWDIDQLADEITHYGYTIERIGGVLKLTPPAPKPQVRREPAPTAPKQNTQAAVETTPQVSDEGWQTARVSWYGPGFYGNKTASGAVLTQGMMNVAHRSMAFGTRIEFRYKGRTCVAVVNDRGPFIAGRTFDLGPGTAQALGFGGVGTVEWRRL